MMSKPLDFQQIEALRRHMLLSVGDMARLCGVSRTGYYAWLKGGPMRPVKEREVRFVVKALLAIMVEHKWPTPDVTAMTQKKRVEYLNTLLGK